MHTPAVDGSRPVNSIGQGSLTEAELARLSEMLEHGQVRSHPPVSSPAAGVSASSDRLAMKRRGKARQPRSVSPQGPGAEPEREWRVARTLDELIELRRALLNETNDSEEVSTP